MYPEPLNEASNVVLTAIHQNLVPDLSKYPGTTTLFFSFDNHSTQKNNALLGYFYKLVVFDKILGPNGVVVIVFPHHVRAIINFLYPLFIIYNLFRATILLYPIRRADI